MSTFEQKLRDIELDDLCEDGPSEPFQETLEILEMDHYLDGGPEEDEFTLKLQTMEFPMMAPFLSTSLWSAFTAAWNQYVSARI